MKHESEQSEKGRREFLTTGARLLGVGGMAAFVAAQAQKSRLLADDPNCIRLYTCSDCVELPHGCQLPKAQDFRASNPSAVEPKG